MSNDKEQIEQTVQVYFDSMYESNSEKVNKAFHPSAMHGTRMKRLVYFFRVGLIHAVEIHLDGLFNLFFVVTHV